MLSVSDNIFNITVGNFIFPSLKGYKLKWVRSDFVAAMVVTAIAIPESLGYAVIVGLPVQAGLYCAFLAPVVFAALTSSKRLVIGADSATAALVASGAATIAVSGTPQYASAIALLGLVTGIILIGMSIARFGFLADLISRPVLVGFISGVGIQLLFNKLPDMLGIAAHGTLFDKSFYLATHLSHIEYLTFLISILVIAIVVAGWKFRLPGALFALLMAIIITKLFHLSTLGVTVIGIVPRGIPSLIFPSITFYQMLHLLPAAFSIAIVILAQSLAVIRNSAARHEEKVKDNRDLMALGFANISSAVMGGFAVNGSPPRTSAGEMAGGHSQLINVIMAILVALVLVFASGLFNYVPSASLAAIIFTIGLHLINIKELKKIWRMRRTEFGIAMIALAGVALLGVQQGVMLAVLLSLLERLRRQYHPHDEVLVRDQVYAQWAKERFRHQLEAPAGLLVYRFNEALFFENSGYFLKRVTSTIKHAKSPVKYFVLDSSAISDIDYTGAQTLERLVLQLRKDDIQLVIAHVSTRLTYLLNRYDLVDLIGKENILPSVRAAIEIFTGRHITNFDRIRSLTLPATQYVVIGGAVLEFLGIRNTKEVDLVVSKKIYNKLNTGKWKEYIQDNGKRILSKDGYKIMTSWMGKDLKELQKSSLTIDGIPLMGIDDLVECKTQLGRKKDKEDIKRIALYQQGSQLPSGNLNPAFARAQYQYRK